MSSVSQFEGVDFLKHSSSDFSASKLGQGRPLGRRSEPLMRRISHMLFHGRKHGGFVLSAMKPRALTDIFARFYAAVNRGTMVIEVGAGAATISRIWRSRDLRSHWCETSKFSNDIRFEEKLANIVGLHIDPLDQAETLTHDDNRHGEATLFAALNIPDGSVISKYQPCNLQIKRLKFLKQIDADVAPDLHIHVVPDNYATIRPRSVLKWLAKHQHFHMHFTATSPSSIKMPGRFFRNLSKDWLKRGVFRSIYESIDAKELFGFEHNEAVKTFAWIVSARDNPQRVMRLKARLNAVQIA